MAEIYEVHGLVRRLGKDAIIELFEKLSVEVDADWAESEKKDLARLAKTLSQLPEERQDEIGRIFDDILEVGGTKSQIPVIMGALEDFGVTPPEHFEHASAPVRAAWCYVNLERRQWMCLRHRTANTNLKKSEWKHFGLAFPEPPEMGCVAAAQKKLEKNLVTAIRKAEHRGHHCRSDCYAVESREIIIFKLTDHPDAEDVWDDNLQDFRPSDNHLAFRIVLSFDHESERMAIHHPSNPKLCARLSRIFADTIFGKDGYSDLSEVFYNLNYFRNKSQLPPSPKHGILNARVTGLPLDKVAARQICVVTVLRGENDPILKECPQGTRHILLVGRLEGEIADEQLKRRVFTFDRILRFQPDGKLEIIREEIEGQLAEKLPETDNKAKPLTPAVKKIANYCALNAFELLIINDYNDLETAMNRLAKVSGKYKEIGVSKGAIAQILNLKGKNPNPDPCAQFWYHCMTCAQEYEHFRYAAKRYPVVRGQIDAQKLYPVYHKLLIESMHLQLSTEHR